MKREMLAVIAVALAAATACGDAGTEAEPAGQAMEMGGTNSAGSCVEQYSQENLAKRDYAFAGTIQAIEPAADDRPDSVEFSVEKWYKGGAGETTTRRAYGFGAVTSAGGSPHQAGERLLVAGDDDFIWECGFTQTYDDEVADQWGDTFDPE